MLVPAGSILPVPVGPVACIEIANGSLWYDKNTTI
jgi:hypothetical protein